MTLKDLIPQEFFVAPPPKRLRPHGTIDLCQRAPYAGQVVVSWGRGCPVFNENLAAARKLKVAGLGTYRPDHGGWVFAPHAIAEIFEEFPTLAVSPAVLDLLAAPPVAPESGKVLHGTIKYAAGGFAVSFGNGYNIPKDAFARYLEAARSIRAASPGSQGWQAASKTWLFSLAAAGRLVLAYPAEHFDHPAELTEAAAKSPAPVNAPPPDRVQANQQAEDKGGADEYATDLLALADLVLATL